MQHKTYSKRSSLINWRSLKPCVSKERQSLAQQARSAVADWLRQLYRSATAFYPSKPRSSCFDLSVLLFYFLPFVVNLQLYFILSREKATSRNPSYLRFCQQILTIQIFWRKHEQNIQRFKLVRSRLGRSYFAIVYSQNFSK